MVKARQPIDDDLANYFRKLAGRDESPAHLMRHVMNLEAMLLGCSQHDFQLMAGLAKEREAALLLLAARRARSKQDLAIKLHAFRIPDPWTTKSSLIEILMRRSLRTDMCSLRVATSREFVTLH